MHLADNPVILQDNFYANHPSAIGITSSPGALISALLPNILVAAGVIFFLLILGAGFSMIMGAGAQKSPQELAKSKSALTMGIIGFLLVITAYFILQIINTITGVNIINPPSL